MSEHVFKKIELTGTSRNSIEEAVQNALAMAAKTVRNMRWFEVSEIRGALKDNKLAEWQVTTKIGFVIEE